MKLNIRNRFACSPDELWDLFLEPEFDRRMTAKSDLDTELLEVRAEGDVEIRRVRVTNRTELPGVVARVVGSKHLTYEQETRLERASGRQSWKVIPPQMADKIIARGVTQVRPQAGGCERAVEGNFEVRIPFVGRQIEKVVVSSVERSFEVAAGVVQAMLAER